jgi:hypothetical protein
MRVRTPTLVLVRVSLSLCVRAVGASTTDAQLQDGVNVGQIGVGERARREATQWRAEHRHRRQHIVGDLNEARTPPPADDTVSGGPATTSAAHTAAPRRTAGCGRGR